LPAAAVAFDRIESRPASQGRKFRCVAASSDIANRRTVSLRLGFVVALVPSALVAYLSWPWTVGGGRLIRRLLASALSTSATKKAPGDAGAFELLF
jgi:hypothetical protein